PDSAGMGAVPFAAAKWLIDGKRRMSPTSARIQAATTGPTPTMALKPMPLCSTASSMTVGEQQAQVRMAPSWRGHRQPSLARGNSSDGQCVAEIRLIGLAQSIRFSSGERGLNLHDLHTCLDEGVGHGAAVLSRPLDPDPPHRVKSSGPAEKRPVTS